MTYLHDRSWWGFWSDYFEHTEMNNVKQSKFLVDVLFYHQKVCWNLSQGYLVILFVRKWGVSQWASSSGGATALATTIFSLFSFLPNFTFLTNHSPLCPV